MTAPEEWTAVDALLAEQADPDYRLTEEARRYAAEHPLGWDEDDFLAEQRQRNPELLDEVLVKRVRRTVRLFEPFTLR